MTTILMLRHTVTSSVTYTLFQLPIATVSSLAFWCSFDLRPSTSQALPLIEDQEAYPKILELHTMIKVDKDADI
jgi:hypothetical protein